MTDTKISRYENYEFEVKNGTLIITISLNESEVDVQPSKSGKNLTIATTGGAKRIQGTPYKLNLTLYMRK